MGVGASRPRNSRRRIGHYSEPLYGQQAAADWGAWERVASRRGANFPPPFLQRGRQVLAHSGADLMRRHVRSWRKLTRHQRPAPTARSGNGLRPRGAAVEAPLYGCNY
jgi:hypothetical protein